MENVKDKSVVKNLKAITSFEELEEVLKYIQNMKSENIETLVSEQFNMLPHLKPTKITIYFGSVYFGFAGDMGYFTCTLPAIGNDRAGVDGLDISGIRGGRLSSGQTCTNQKVYR